MSLKNRKNKEHLANRTKLIEACASGDLETVEQLVGIVKNLNRALDGDTPLTVACRLNQPEIVAFLISNGADVNSETTDDTPLHNAILSRNRTMVRMLLQAGANPNASCQAYGQLALELALVMQCSEIAAELLNFGARIDNLSEDGSQLGQLLAWSGSEELLDAVCKKPQWFEATTSGWVPLLHSLAFWGGVKYLKRAALDGADINAFTSAYMRTTPLHQACINGGGKCVQALLNLGADVDAVDGLGHTPLELALRWGQADSALVIVKATRRSFREPLYGKTLHEWFSEDPNAMALLETAISESVETSLLAELGCDAASIASDKTTTRQRGLML
jgi:ankyrin repeat protein